MPFFADLVPEAHRLLLPAGFTEESIESRFAARDGENGVHLQSSALRHGNGTVLKSAYLTSPRAEIIFLMIYPADSAQTPVLALEYIALGGKPFLAVLDLQPVPAHSPLRERVAESLKTAYAEASAQLTGGGEKPDWAQAYFSPVALYSRPDKAEEIPVLLRAYSLYLQAWLTFFSPKENARAEEEMRRYLQHHLVHTPGRPFLTKVFGAEWTEAYLGEFIYAL